MTLRVLRGDMQAWKLPAAIFVLVLCLVGLMIIATSGSCVHERKHAYGILNLINRVQLHTSCARDNAISAIATVAIAAFTATLWRATTGLLTTGQREVGHLERTAKRQLRACVAIQWGSGELRGLGSQFINIDNVLQNFGQTPGYDFTTWIKHDLRPTADPVPFGAPTPLGERIGASIIGPGQQDHVGTLVPTDNDMVNAIISRDRTLYVWGGARYRDAFGKIWNFSFHAMIVGEVTHPATRDRGATWALRPHSVGYHEVEGDT
jgi:hypothetical protein